jgi:hypothetical protein
MIASDWPEQMHQYVFATMSRAQRLLPDTKSTLYLSAGLPPGDSKRLTLTAGLPFGVASPNDMLNGSVPVGGSFGDGVDR